MANESSSNEKSISSDLSENEAIVKKPVRAAAAKARKTLFSKEKKSSSSGNLSTPSTKSWGSTKSGRIQIAKRSQCASDHRSSPKKEEEIVIPRRHSTRSPTKVPRELDENSGYPCRGSLRSPIKAPSGLFKRGRGRPRGSKNRAVSTSARGARGSKRSRPEHSQGGKCFLSVKSNIFNCVDMQSDIFLI